MLAEMALWHFDGSAWSELPMPEGIALDQLTCLSSRRCGV